jgi:hypothetical protein
MGGGFNQNLLIKFMSSKVCEEIQKLFKMLMKFLFFCSLQEITTFLTGNFSKKKPLIWFFCPHVQLDQNAILDLTILIRSF